MPDAAKRAGSLAAIQYASESLLAPQVVASGVMDPQVGQIQQIITPLLIVQHEGDCAGMKIGLI